MNELIYRGIKNYSWLGRGEIKTTAFMRQKPEIDPFKRGDPSGLSIVKIYDFPNDPEEFPEFINEATHLKIHGLIELEEESVNAIAFGDYSPSVTMDAPEDGEDRFCHGNIVDLPYYKDHPLEAERLASMLVDISAVAYLTTRDARKRYLGRE